MGSCDPGLRASTAKLVREADTAAAHGCGDQHVLGSPTILEMAEQACVRALANEVPADQTSVEAATQIANVRAARPGTTVHADATLVGHHGRRLRFNVIVRDDAGVLARVTHERLLVLR